MELLESGSVRPRQARYQAALRPDMKCRSILRHFLQRGYLNPDREIRKGIGTPQHYRNPTSFDNSGICGQAMPALAVLD